MSEAASSIKVQSWPWSSQIGFKNIYQRDLKNQKLIFDIKRQLNWYNHPFDICLNPLVVCKEGWCVGLGQRAVA